MRLTPRLVVAQTIAISAVLIAECWLQLDREKALFERDTEHDHLVLARAIASAVAGSEAGPADAARIAEEASRAEGDVTVRWWWADELERAQIELRQPRFERWSNREWIAALLESKDAPPAFRSRYPLVRQGRLIGAIEIDESATTASAYLRSSIIRTLFTTLIAVAVLAGSSTAFVMLLVGRPTRELMLQARRIGAGDLSPAPVGDGNDEITELARDINTMSLRIADARSSLEQETAHRIVALEALRRADRLATVGHLASGLAHELGTPINVISAHAELIADRAVEGPKATESAAIIIGQTDRMTRLVRQLLDFARPREPSKRLEDVRALSARTLATLSPLAEKSGVRLDLSGGAPELPIDPAQLEQVITNLVINAIQASDRGAQVSLSVEEVTACAPEDPTSFPCRCVVIRVRDHGAGIPAENRSKLFDPFFTTKAVGSGTGLGLSIVHAIVREHGGWIEVDSEPGSGSEFAVHFPAGDQDAGSQESRS